MKITLGGWVLAFLGIATMGITAVVTLVQSLSIDHFVWSDGQTDWAITGAILFVAGVLVFVAGVFGVFDR